MDFMFKDVCMYECMWVSVIYTDRFMGGLIRLWVRVFVCGTVGRNMRFIYGSTKLKKFGNKLSIFSSDNYERSSQKLR